MDFIDIFNIKDITEKKIKKLAKGKKIKETLAKGKNLSRKHYLKFK